MYLKTVNINGFKSFSENTNIDFSNKVNVVVGPNGSGKSNVVDAISWVLGTQSPGSLRTNKMEDVIFAGTDKLSQKGYAEVNLNFEVDPKKFNGTEEISIGRKLYRDGQSEYFMNGLNCRLLDIQEFLSDVGIGRQQHTIISQGQIAEILNSKPEDHRITIEEAAGILPYKIKKDKALRRIESGDKEIKRAKDVLREINKQLKPLKVQAHQASLHENATNELKDLKIKFNILNYKNYISKNESLKNEIKDINKELDLLKKLINKNKNDKKKINDNLGENISLGSIFKDYSNKVITNAEKIKNINQIANERLDNIERMKLNNNKDIEKQKKKILDNTHQISSMSGQLITKKNSVKENTKKLEKLNQDLMDAMQKDNLTLEINEAVIRTELKYLQENINYKKNIILDNEEKLMIWNKDIENNSILIKNHENILDDEVIDKSKFNNLKEKINIIYDREMKNIKNTIEVNKDIKINNSRLIKQKNEQLNLVNDKDQFKSEIKKQIDKLKIEIKELENEISSISSQVVSTTEKIKYLNSENLKIGDNIKILNKINYNKQIKNLNDISHSSRKLYVDLKNSGELLKTAGYEYETKYGDDNKSIESIENEIEANNNKFYSLKDKKSDLQIKESELSNESLNYYSYLSNIEGMTIDEINNYDILYLNESEILENIRKYENTIEKIGIVNYLAKEDYDNLINRHDEIQKSIDDLLESKKELNEHISEIEKEIEFTIDSSFNSISVNFSEIFEKLFPGGNGSLQLTNKDNLLETGIEINVQPRGKKVKKLSLLSGGEKSLAAIAFLFAIFKSFPSPFYILDEVEAALDDANLHRMINLLEYLKDDAQFVIVTHQQQTMHAADILYGVTMEPGSGSRIFIKTKEDFETLVLKEKS